MDILIPKEPVLSTNGSITPFFVIVKGMAKFLLQIYYIDTCCQKDGFPVFSSCTTHAMLIWDQIQSGKRQKKDSHVVWLDLENPYGSVPHQLINIALNYFHVPVCVKHIIESYFVELKI